MQKYFYLLGSKIKGPYTLEELKKTNPHPTTLIWHKELQHWIHARDSKELRSHFGLSSNKLINLKNIFSKLVFKTITFDS